MIQIVTWYDFSDWFTTSDTYKNNFSYEGLQALYDYLNELEESTDEQIEFDPIAICCDYTEFDSAKDAVAEYGAINESDSMDEDFAKDWLRDKTQIIECENGHLIIQNF